MSKHIRFEENILVDEDYTNFGIEDKNADNKKGYGIAKNFADSLDYGEKKKWFQQLPEEPSTTSKTLSHLELEACRKEANSALHGDTLAYETKASKSGSSDYQWAKTLLNKGTIGDRVAAATILIQDNPAHNLTALRNLVNSVKPAKKKDGIVIIDALSELFISDLLIPDAKLRTFDQHSLGHLDEITSGNKQTRRNILKLWHYEDQLKELYGSYVEALNKFAHDSVEANKEKAVSAMSYLLMHHPEREKMLLTNIINKLGDPSQTVASKVIYHLCQLLYNHPNMKNVVLAEIEKMLFRPNISPRAQYYGVCFLNQFYLGKDDSKIAEGLIRIYFSFFKASIKKGEIDSRLMSAILTGVKRAYPFADKERLTDASAHIDAIHRLVHLAGVNVAIHALALLFHVSDTSKGISDRYYSALYKKLINPEIFSTSHSALLFSLIYKSLKQDKSVDRVAAFVKRLLQLCCYMTPGQVCGMLFLVSQVLKDASKKDALKLTWTKKEVKEENTTEPQDLDAEDLETSKEESQKEENVKDPIEEVEMEVKKENKKFDLLIGDKKDLLLDDEEETYVDLKIDDEGNVKPKRRVMSAVSGWFHAKVKPDDVQDKELETKIQLKKSINMERVITEYNPFARNPAFCGATCSAYLELLPLAAHFHPTVKLFAEKLINNQIIQYQGDPLKDFSGIRFLDRFVFKNPKRQTDNQHDGQLKKVKGSHPKFAVRKNYVPKGLRSVPLNSSSYLNEDAAKIPVDEQFLYEFLQKRRKDVDDDDDDDSDNDSVTSVDFEKYLDTVTGTKTTEPNEELDFMSEMQASLQRKSKKGEEGSDEEIDEDDGDDEDVPRGDNGSDGELEMSGDDDEPMLSGEDDDELQLENSDDDDDIVDVPEIKSGKSKKFNLKGGDDLGSLFASAEEFSTLLEDTATNKKQGSSQAVSNTDNSSVKQLAWEEKRDRWIKGYNKNILGNKTNKKRFNKSKVVIPAGKSGKRRGGKPDGAGGKKRKSR